jgi:hypothetical protein
MLMGILKWELQGSKAMRSRKILAWGSILLVLAIIPCLGQEKTKGKVLPKPVIELPFPMGGVAEGPETTLNKNDLSMNGPGGSRFVYLEDKNLEPKETAEAAAVRVPGPGEPGFLCQEQKNLYPGESTEEKKSTAVIKKK